jgi:DNA-binding transcriptional regulator YiaG
MALTDDIERLTSIMTAQLVLTGECQALRQRARLSLSELGKAAGVAGDVVDSWERGYGVPSTAQSLAWLTALYAGQPRTPQMGMAPAAVNGAAR